MWPFQIGFSHLVSPRLIYRSPPKGHVGCFQVWAFTNRAAINIHVQIFVWTCFQLLWVYTKEYDWWIICKSIFHFVRNHQSLPKWLYNFTYPLVMNRVRIEFLWLHILASTGVVIVLDFGYSNRCVVVSHFSLHFPDDIGCGASFPSVYLFW